MYLQERRDHLDSRIGNRRLYRQLAVFHIFTDMFIPALLAVGLTSVKTKFVIGVLSLVQIIYLTEVGTIIIKSEIPLNNRRMVTFIMVYIWNCVMKIPLNNRRMVTFMCSRKVMEEALIFRLLFQSG